MPVYTAQSPEFRQSIHEANQRNLARHQQAAGARAPPPAVLQEDDPVVLRQFIQGMQQRQRDAFLFGDNLIAQFFIIQSKLSDQQRERLTSAMSLRNITLENYTYEMLNDAPRRWWNILDSALRSYGLVPTRADRCTYVYYGKQLPKPTSISEKKPSNTFDVEGAVDCLMDPVSGNNAKNRQVHGALSLHADDLLIWLGTMCLRRKSRDDFAKTFKSVPKTKMIASL